MEIGINLFPGTIRADLRLFYRQVEIFLKGLVRCICFVRCGDLATLGHILWFVYSTVSIILNPLELYFVTPLYDTCVLRARLVTCPLKTSLVHDIPARGAANRLDLWNIEDIA